jgi:hypothetical protein
MTLGAIPRGPRFNSQSVHSFSALMVIISETLKEAVDLLSERKSNTFQHFREWQALVECQSGLKIKAHCSDNGGEYTVGQFQLHLCSKGISSQLSVAYTPQQKGAAEQLNQTVQDTVRAMLVQSGLSSSLWAEAVCYRPPCTIHFSLHILLPFPLFSLLLSLCKTITADCAPQTVHCYLCFYCRLWTVPTVASCIKDLLWTADPTCI